MQTKTIFVLYIIIVMIALTIVVRYTHERQEIKQSIICVEEIKEDENSDSIEENYKKIEIEIDKEVDTKVVEPVSLGEFKLTAYCSCSICCGKWANNRPIDKNGNEIVYGAIGEELKEGYSIAVDPSIIPYKTEVIINGHIYKAQDCGGGINGKEIDIYFEDHNDALKFGLQYAEVFVNCKNLN